MTHGPMCWPPHRFTRGSRTRQYLLKYRLDRVVTQDFLIKSPKAEIVGPKDPTNFIDTSKFTWVIMQDPIRDLSETVDVLVVMKMWVNPHQKSEKCSESS
jgi:hypothetical protein